MTVRTNNPSDESLPTVFPFPKKPYASYDSTYTVGITHFYFSDEFKEPELYTDVVHRLNTAGEHDVIYMHLNTPGGRLDTGVQLINAIANTQAKVVTLLESEAHSLGTLIFLSGDEMVINEHCMMMFHNYSGGVGGKGHEQIAHLAAETKRMSSLMHDICVPFLSIEEVQRIINGEDIWLASPEIRTRMNKMIKTLTEEAEKPKAARTRSRKSKDGTPAPETSTTSAHG